jgi:cobalt-zinc-cadmium efflux system membrane fusion protein
VAAEIAHRHEPPAKQAEDPATQAGSGRESVELDSTMRNHISVEEVADKTLPKLLTVTGKVQLNEDRIARILAPVSGQVTQLSVKVGDRVKKGSPLFFINSREVAAAIAEHLESHKDLDLAEKTCTMTKDLFEHQASSRIALQQAENELVKARGRVMRTEETLRVLGADLQSSELHDALVPRIPVRAPLDCAVIERHVAEGQFVQPDNNPLLVLADLSTVWVQGDVFERDLHLVQLGQRVEVATAAYPERSFVARVTRISDLVEPATRTVKVNFLVSNPAGMLKPEMFARATLTLAEPVRVLTVPAKAVFSEGDKSFVYVRVPGDRFVRREVEIALESSARVRILRGLQSGEWVVTDGATLLSQEQGRKATS